MCREDIRFLTSFGSYSVDIKIYGDRVVVFARSKVASGPIKSINTDSAIPGVFVIFTGEDFLLKFGITLSVSLLTVVKVIR